MTISRHAFTELLSRNIFPLRRKVRWIKKRRRKKRKKNVQTVYSTFCEIKNPFSDVYSDSSDKTNSFRTNSIQSPLPTIQELNRTNKKRKGVIISNKIIHPCPFFFARIRIPLLLARGGSNLSLHVKYIPT